MHIPLDPNWLAAICSLAGIVITLVTILFNRKKKALSATILSRADLASINDDAKDDIQILWRGREVASPKIIQVQLENTGRTPINQSDFENKRPIEITFTGENRILTAYRGSVSPETLVPVWKIDRRSLQILPLLLNPKDRFKLTLIMDGQVGEMVPRARISGVQCIEQVDPKKVAARQRTIAWIGIAVSLLIVLGVPFASTVRSMISFRSQASRISAEISQITQTQSVDPKRIAEVRSEIVAFGNTYNSRDVFMNGQQLAIVWSTLLDIAASKPITPDPAQGNTQAKDH